MVQNEKISARQFGILVTLYANRNHHLNYSVQSGC